MKTYISIILLLLILCQCNKKPKNENPPLAPTEIVTDTVIKRSIPKANNSLAYLGMYKGTLPCSDCAGIETSLQLSEDFTYSLTKTYKGKTQKPTEQKGTYSWNKDETAIILDNLKESPNQFLVGEKVLTLLDTNGEIMKGNSNYILRKMTEAESQKTDAPKVEPKPIVKQ